MVAGSVLRRERDGIPEPRGPEVHHRRRVERPPKTGGPPLPAPPTGEVGTGKEGPAGAPFPSPVLGLAPTMEEVLDTCAEGVRTMEGGEMLTLTMRGGGAG